MFILLLFKIPTDFQFCSVFIFFADFLKFWIDSSVVRWHFVMCSNYASVTSATHWRYFFSLLVMSSDICIDRKHFSLCVDNSVFHCRKTAIILLLKVYSIYVLWQTHKFSFHCMPPHFAQIDKYSLYGCVHRMPNQKSLSNYIKLRPKNTGCYFYKHTSTYCHQFRLA